MNTYWMRADSGAYSFVEGAAERDRWTPLGWRESPTEPADTDLVWMSAPEVGPAPLPWGAREYWASRGWKPSAPPEPVDLTKDPRLADVPADVPSEPAKSASKKESK